MTDTVMFPQSLLSFAEEIQRRNGKGLLGLVRKCNNLLARLIRRPDLVVSGRVLLVGGGVISHLTGLPVKDWDLEVYGFSYEEIVDLLEKKGFRPNIVGRAFGVINVDLGGIPVDISLPRKENRIGVGHKDFDVQIVANLDPREAARRRDLTINSMMVELPSGRLIDPFGGQADLAKGCLRATSPDTFVEDPLRVLRVMQLLPRKGKFVDPKLLSLCQRLKDSFGTLPKERVFEEFNKLLLKAQQPSMGLEFLLASGWLAHFPELASLVGCQQNPLHHPEGDVWTHTLLVVDNAARVRDNLPLDWQLPFMYGALLHDVGKPVVQEEDLSSPGHDKAGEPLAEAFMRRLTNETVLIERVISVVGNHMAPGQFISGHAGCGAWRRLHNRVPLDIIGWMSKCDSCGRWGYSWEDPHPPSEKALELAREFGQGKIPPALMGRHLIERGMKPGRDFKTILDKAYQHQLDTGETDPDVLFQVGVSR